MKATTLPRVSTPASNPFATRFVRPGSLPYRFDAAITEAESDANFREIVRRLDRHQTGLIVGPHGSGKTTLLHALAPWLSHRYPQIANVRLTASAWCGAASSLRCRVDKIRHRRRLARLVESQQSRLGGGGLLILDGAEQLSPVDWTRLRWRVGRRGQKMLATSHAPRWGVPILWETAVNGVLVESLTQSLLAAASPEVVKIVRRELLAQDWSTLTNVRDLWFDMYDVVQPHLTASLR